MTPVFISFKWKIIGLTTIPLLIAAAGILYTNYSSMQQQFQLQRERLHEQRQENVTNKLSTLKQSIYDSTQKAINQRRIRQALKTANKTKLKRTFNNQWLPLQIKHNLTSIVFYSHEKELIENWGSVSINQNRVIESNHTNKISWNMECDNICQVFMQIPLEKSGFALVGFSANIITDYLATTNTPTALIVPSKNIRAPELPNASLPKYQLYAKNKESISQNDINSISSTLDKKDNHIIKRGKQYYEVKTFDISSISNMQNISLIGIDDVSRDIIISNKSITNQMLYLASGLSLMLLFLGLSLNETSSRIHRLNSVLRHLKIDRENNKKHLSLLKRTKEINFTNDEIDIIQDALMDYKDEDEIVYQGNVIKFSQQQ
jgi:hypothetical protein